MFHNNPLPGAGPGPGTDGRETKPVARSRRELGARPSALHESYTSTEAKRQDIGGHSVGNWDYP